MSDVLSFNPNRALTANIGAAAAAKAYFYDAGTANLKTVYADVGLTTAHPSPLLADSAGVFAAVFTDGTPTKVVVQTSGGSTLYTLDPADTVSVGGLTNFDTVAELLADTRLTYGAGYYMVAAGNILTAEGFRYEVAASGASDQHVTTAGGVKLYVQAGDAGYNVKAFGAVGNGVADDTAEIQAAITAANPNVWAASFNYQQGGGIVYLPKGVYRITSSIKLAPFVTLEGDGCDGWTGGGAGIGLTSGISPANGSAIFADFGATTETCAIDTQNWSVTGGTLYAATDQTLILNAQLGGTYTYCQGVGLRGLAIFCTNQTRVGVRLQGAALAKIEDISIVGFKVGLLSNCVWSTEYRNVFSLSYQVGLAAVTNNEVRVSGVFDLYGWGSSNGTAITNNNVVTAGNKPTFWSANDTNYNGTGLYAVSCNTLHFENVTVQHCGRAVYAEGADLTFGTIYIEDLPFLSSGSTPGAFNAYNGSAGSTSITINHMHSDSNGVTLFNNITNTPITLLNLSGIQGTTYGPTGTGTLLIGNNVNRNGAFGDTNFDSRIVNIVPQVGSWTPSLTNISGTGVVAAGYWVKRGNVIDMTISITGTGLTATGGGASVISIPFGITAGFPPPVRASAAAVSTANAQAVSGFLQNNANLYIGAVTSTTQIIVSCQLFAT